MTIEEASDTLSLLGSLRFVSSLEGWDELVQCAATVYVDGRTKKHWSSMCVFYIYFSTKSEKVWMFVRSMVIKDQMICTFLGCV